MKWLRFIVPSSKVPIGLGSIERKVSWFQPIAWNSGPIDRNWLMVGKKKNSYSRCFREQTLSLLLLPHMLMPRINKTYAKAFLSYRVTSYKNTYFWIPSKDVSYLNIC